MIEDADLNAWFCREVLPLEGALTSFILRNWRRSDDVLELRQDIYERTLNGARASLPANARAFLFTVARNHLINNAIRARIVSFELVADLEGVVPDTDLFATDRNLDARDQLRRARAGMDALPPRCRDVVRLRKVEGLTTRETAERLGIGLDTVERQLTMGMRALVDFMLGGTGKIRRPRAVRRARSDKA
ncbi:RNA polymerase sigma factor [Sphingomonas sp. AR_OL41]|uniref:RNA polymerase sigma factor n=1 Tax=Sphingomonas sp. AR_OL41 TaxID=3042729 RepID=UPI00248116E0|nr:RNA polymerase sigma factor [Sphingomonas sp. AR_OL41]MDH7974478.1 RNA polymerase sigma factor [Sphingomonas sp. AR_OL41]